MIVAEDHERVVLFMLELFAIEIQARLVLVGPARRRAKRGTVAALVAEICQDRDLELLVHAERVAQRTGDAAAGGLEIGQPGLERHGFVRHDRQVRAYADANAAHLMAVQASARLFFRHGIRHRDDGFLEILPLL
ncbi:MAG TPA: hypothetical protein VIH35_00900 [Kiritimatiellia bacterium]